MKETILLLEAWKAMAIRASSLTEEQVPETGESLGSGNSLGSSTAQAVTAV